MMTPNGTKTSTMTNQERLQKHLDDPEFQERFWSNVQIGDPDQCWLWIGSNVDGDGYGRVGPIAASRISKSLTTGIAFSREVHVLHSCDNRLCCNPHHLFLGNQFINVMDAVSKGRNNGARGSQNRKAKFTEDQVEAIRVIQKDVGVTYKMIGMQFGITGEQASNIMRGKAWKSL